MAQNPLAPPPQTGTESDRWLYLLWRRLTQAGQILWASLDFGGSNLTDLETRQHKDLQGLQGGDATDQYHLTAAQHTGLTTGVATTLHKHDHNNQDGKQGGTAGEYYHLTQLEYTGSGSGVFVRQTSPTIVTPTVQSQKADTIIVAKASGNGIKLEHAAPTFGWHDLLGEITIKGAGGGGPSASPDYVVYRGNIYGYRFGTNAPNNHMHEAFNSFHIPHDYAEGTDLYIHVHWSQITVDTGGTAGVPGNAKWYFDLTYAKGHGTPGGAADPFVAPITVSVVQQASTTQYGHMIAEVQISNAGGTGGLLDSTKIQVDGLLLSRLYRDPADAADTLNQDVFVHYIDVHYQSTGIPTKNKAPNFY